ncbi:MAG: hypothetical protein N2C14_05300, partial [Planctomycetales bacterium]
VAAAVMAAALCFALSWVPPGGSFPHRLSRVLIPMTLGIGVYFAVARLVGLTEWKLFVGREETL